MTQQRLSTNDYYSTSDLALATVISLSYPLEVIGKTQNPHKALFVFNRSKNLNELVDKYWKKELLVEPRTYFDQLKALKNRLYSNE